MEEIKNKKLKNKLQTGHKMSFTRHRDYYFHADEDFREDWQWGKDKNQRNRNK